MTGPRIMVSEHSDRPRILALRALGLGDFLTGIPALRALRRHRPDARLLLAAPRALAPLVRLSGTVDGLIDVGELEPIPWHGPAPELAVDLHGRGAPSHRLLGALRPRRLIAFADPAGGYPDGPSWRAGEHEVRRWCRLLSEEGIPADPDELDLLPGPDALVGADPLVGAGPLPSLDPLVGAGPLVGASLGAPGFDGAPLGGPACDGAGSSGAPPSIVHPGAAAPSRRWGADRFAAVACELARDGAEVLITAGPSERELAGEVIARASLPGGALATGMGLDALAALVARAALVVSGDTGIAHLATAVRTPSVVLFGPVPPSEWGPPSSAASRHVALWRGHPGYRGDPHGTSIDPMLDALTVREVLDAVHAHTLLRSSAG